MSPAAVIGQLTNQAMEKQKQSNSLTATSQRASLVNVSFALRFSVFDKVNQEESHGVPIFETTYLSRSEESVRQTSSQCSAASTHQLSSPPLLCCHSHTLPSNHCQLHSVKSLSGTAIFVLIVKVPVQSVLGRILKITKENVLSIRSSLNENKPIEIMNGIPSSLAVAHGSDLKRSAWIQELCVWHAQYYIVVYRRRFIQQLQFKYFRQAL